MNRVHNIGPIVIFALTFVSEMLALNFSLCESLAQKRKWDLRSLHSLGLKSYVNEIYAPSLTIVFCFCFKTDAGCHLPTTPTHFLQPRPQAGLEDPPPGSPGDTHGFHVETACLFT